MSKLVFVCMDKEYIEAVMGKLASAFGRNHELEFITEISYWETYLQTAADVDFLIIDEAVISEAANVKAREVFVLTENREAVRGKFLYKYFSGAEMAAQMGIQGTIDPKTEKNKTKVISVYSPGGGSGKTLAALSIAKYLSRQDKKVLYLNTEMLQDFQVYLKSHEYMNDGNGYRIAAGTENGIDLLLEHIKHEEFDFVPAFEKPLFTYHIDFLHFVKLTADLKEKHQYDYLIVELSQEMQAEKMNFICKSDEVVYVCTPNPSAAVRMNQMIGIMSGLKGKGALVCNRVGRGGNSNRFDSGLREKFAFYEEIAECDGDVTLDYCMQNQLFMNTAFSVM